MIELFGWEEERRELHSDSEIFSWAGGGTEVRWGMEKEQPDAFCSLLFPSVPAAISVRTWGPVSLWLRTRTMTLHWLSYPVAVT